jgi:sugar transferase (PEP-CTERM system associated)
MKFKSIARRKVFLLAGDLLIILFATFCGFYIRFGKTVNFFEAYTIATVINIFIFPISFYIADLYNLHHNFKSAKGTVKFLLSMGGAIVVIAALFYALPPYRFGRGVFFYEVLVLAPLIILWRILFNSYWRIAGKAKHILFEGKSWVSESLFEEIKDNLEYKVVGFLNSDVLAKSNPYPTSMPVYQMEEVEEKLKTKDLDGIVVDQMENRSPQSWNLLLQYKMAGVEIMDAATLYQDLTGKVPVYSVDDKWFVNSQGFVLLRSSIMQRIKMVWDLVMSPIVLIVSLPLMGLIALAIKLDSKAPVFYRQRRVGQGGRIFEVIKFRTMMKDAEEGCGAVWASSNDERTTRVGKILRLTRLDELPQLINVLKEEMSFVGPRPERPEFVRELEKKIPYYSLRHTVKPGITGWAQVNYRYGASVEDAIEKLKYDLFYVQNMSIFLDLRILLKTIQVVLFTRGSR